MRNSLSSRSVVLPRNFAGRGPEALTRPAAKDRTCWYRIENAADGESDTTKIYLYDEIGGFWGIDAQEFVKDLMAVDTPKIALHINSPGGGLFDAVAIYNSLMMHKAEIDVFIDGLAASAASFIAQAGDKVHMAKSATMMIHDAAAICMGNEQDMLDTAALLSKMSNTIADIYAERAGEDTVFWRALMREEVWYSADEALAVNLIDDIVQPREEDSAENKWDLSIFNYAGRSAAPSPQKIRTTVFNRAKEASVGVKNTSTEPAPADEPTAAPATEPAAPVEEPTEAPTTAPVVPAEPAAPATAPAEPEPQNTSSVVINGKKVTNFAEIQNYIKGLEGSINETKNANRKAFIKQLCDSNKVAAPQVASLEAFVLGSDGKPGLTDEQYETWCASWDAAPSIGLFGKNVTGGVTNSTGDPNNSSNQELEDALEIVRQHKRSNMPKAALEKTQSYQKLVAANAVDRI